MTLLVRSGVPQNDPAIKYTESFLQTRGLEYLDFNFFMDELTLSLRTSVRTGKTTLSPVQVHMAATIVWAMTGGRSWMTGEKISFDKVFLHHIRHDAAGYTLYGGFYDSLSGHNFAALTGKQNHEVETYYPSTGMGKEEWQDKFIYMWNCFLKGDFKAATDHWNDVDPNFQLKFLSDRKSMGYLDYWLGLL